MAGDEELGVALMRGHKWKGEWPWEIFWAEAKSDYKPFCQCAFCRKVREVFPELTEVSDD